MTTLSSKEAASAKRSDAVRSAALSAGEGARRGSGTLRDYHEEERVGKAHDTRLLSRLWPFVRPHRAFVALSIGLLVLGSALNIARPLLMGRLVANVQSGVSGSLFSDGMALTALVLCMQLVTFAQMYTMQTAGARAMFDLRAHVFDFLQRLELRFYDKTPVGRLVTRATNDVDALGELFASGVINAIGDLISLVGIVVMMLSLNVKMSLIAFATLPIVGLVVRYVRRRAREAYREIRLKTARLNAFLNEQVAGMSVVQAYAREASMADEFDAINVEYRDANKNAVFYEAVLDAAIEMVGTVCIASILWWAGVARLSGEGVTFSLVVVFTQYIRQFFEPVSLLATRYTVLQSAMSGAERIFSLLDETSLETTSEAPTPASTSELGPERACCSSSNGEGNKAERASHDDAEAIALDHVTFAYKPGVNVLHDVSLCVRRGEQVALVGATGAGKTTVTSILLRLYDLASGEARVFGKDIRAYARRELRQLFSVVPQDVFLFAGTVAGNIAMSDDGDPDLRRVEQALERIGALDVFLTRPGGLLAAVEERGANFSAGERQLIAFARALYKDAPIVILDEATASIDSDTESRLQRALEVVMQGRTALIIAHRLSTIRAVHRIVVFHRGKIAESGTHDQLLAADGVYARLYRLQLSAEGLESKRMRNASMAQGGAA